MAAEKPCHLLQPSLINYINYLYACFCGGFFHSEEDDSWYTMQVWTLAAGLGCGLMAHLATRMFSRGVPTPVGGTVPPQNLDSWMNFPFSTNNKMVLVVRTDLRCRPCPFIQNLSWFFKNLLYPNFIVILSRFFLDFLETYFIQILSLFYLDIIWIRSC